MLGKSQSQILAMFSSRELSEVAIFLGMEPQGEERADLRAGIVASTIANINRKKGSKALKPTDFMPKFGEGEKTPEEQASIDATMERVFGGTINKGEGS